MNLLGATNLGCSGQLIKKSVHPQELSILHVLSRGLCSSVRILMLALTEGHRFLIWVSLRIAQVDLADLCQEGLDSRVHEGIFL